MSLSSPLIELVHGSVHGFGSTINGDVIITDMLPKTNAQKFV